MRKLVLALGVPLFALAVPASAHFNLTMPPSIAKSTEGGKGPAPCGPDTAATGTITPVTGGQMLALHIDETTPHPGFYRFALSSASPPTFPADNVVKDKNGMVLLPTSNGLSSTAEFEDPAKFPVLADHVFSHGDVGVQGFPSQTYPGQVMVPNMNCEKCTLQVIEFMANHGSNGDSAGFFYHHCALIKITVDPAKPIFDPNAPGGAGGAGGAGNAGAGGSSAAGAGGVATAGGGAGGASAGTSSAGAPAAGGALATGGSPSAAGSSAAGANSLAGAAVIDEPPADSGGCSYALGRRSDVFKPALALLLGLLAFRRRRARASRG
jgi:hypothetical protein